MEKWKQSLGPEATYRRLIGVFESANYKGYADEVRSVVGRSLGERHTRQLSNLDPSN